MLVYQLNVVAAVALLIRLITRVKSQGTFVHSDLGGHTITNEIRFPNVDWQYAEPTGTLIKSENTGSREEKKPDTEFLNLRQQLEIVRASATIDLAQSAYIDILRQLQSKTEKAGLDELLMMHPDVLAVKEDTYPYEYISPLTSIDSRGVDYTQEIIFDPCRNKPDNCCYDKYGTPEYYDWRTKEVYYADRKLVIFPFRRLPDDIKKVQNVGGADGVCLSNSSTGNFDRRTKVALPDGNVTYEMTWDDKSCEEQYLLRKLSPVMPDCWDYNESVSATTLDERNHIYSNLHDGTKHIDSVTIAYTYNGWIIDCAGEYAGSNKCGTYLEIHVPGDERIVSEKRLPGGLMNGYRTIDLPLIYKFNYDRVICAGNYEIWWVLRTPSSKVVEYIKKFKVLRPACDFNRILNKYTRFFDFRFELKNSLSDDTISLDDLLDISTTN
eukprot:g9464.t1